MANGVVKWFNSTKGYGFVCPAGGGPDIFIHYSSILMEGYRSLKAGQLIDYELHDGPKGLHATNIRAVERNAQPMPAVSLEVATEEI